jgi:hypothetical protein
VNLVLAPEPASWLRQLPTLLGPHATGVVFAPWAVPALPSGWMPARLRAAWQRRSAPVPPGFRVLPVPGWAVLEAGLRWTSRSTAATLRTRFVLRRLLAQACAPLLPAGVTTVVAPSLCAREVFAVARARGARCVLVEDLPALRALHADLDEAAARHPDEPFLRNHRASARDVARQEAEQLLADALWVRSAFVRELLRAGGHTPDRLHALPHLVGSDALAQDVARAPRERGTPLQVLLAGPATARGGLREALAALDARPGWSLRVRPSEGTNLALLAHPRVQQVNAKEQQRLEGVDVVLAPAWCESDPPELAHAVARGLPTIATDRAAGFLPCSRVPRGDVSALVSALEAVA